MHATTNVDLVELLVLREGRISATKKGLIIVLFSVNYNQAQIISFQIKRSTHVLFPAGEIISFC